MARIHAFGCPASYSYPVCPVLHTMPGRKKPCTTDDPDPARAPWQPGGNASASDYTCTRPVTTGGTARKTRSIGSVRDEARAAANRGRSGRDESGRRGKRIRERRSVGRDSTGTHRGQSGTETATPVLDERVPPLDGRIRRRTRPPVSRCLRPDLQCGGYRVRPHP